MYAVIVDSGTQFFVEEGQRLLVGLRDIPAGTSIEFDQVLMLGGTEGGPVIGQPNVAGAKVLADVLGERKLKKIHMGFYRKRKNYRRHRGHSQRVTEIEIRTIVPA